MKKIWIWAISILVVLVIFIIGGFIFRVFFSCGNAGSCDEPSIIQDGPIKAQIAILYGEQKRVAVYPDYKRIEVPLGKSGKFVLGIRNNEDHSLNFSYEIVIADNKSEKDCVTSKQDLMSIIRSGSSQSNIILGSNNSYMANVSFSPGYGDPICNVRYRINVYANGDIYGVEEMDVNFKL